MSDSGSQPSDDHSRWTRLTAKQRACLDLVLDHQTSKQIARRLDISKQAVDLRLTTARDTLGASNRAEAAIIYGRLRRTYDRISCDPVIVAPAPELMPFDTPNGDVPVPVAMHESTLMAHRPGDSSPPFRDFWRCDHSLVRKAWIMAAMLAALLLLILSGLAIAQSLTRLISG